jgi:hypothetical protein
VLTPDAAAAQQRLPEATMLPTGRAEPEAFWTARKAEAR